ncbi:MAG: nicotinamide mononucleotide transporter [Clostridia bacterium]|nr:nicotinamide mononucleotide transporter [Clostridia bacterium]
MSAVKRFFAYFTIFEKLLWLFSVTITIATFFIFKNKDYITLASCLIGVSSLIFCAKGNPFGMMLMIFFATFYGVVSFICRYYGEVITYVGMTMPMSILSLISWLKNRHTKTEVKVRDITKKDVYILIIATTIITLAFFFILKALKTSNLPVSTLSITTSFVAVYLTYKRSPLFALAYAVNDIVLITLWTIQSFISVGYVPVAVCFTVFLINDLYSYFNWLKMRKRQGEK